MGGRWRCGGLGGGGGTLILTYLYVCLHCSVFKLECVFFIVSNLQWLLFIESYLLPFSFTVDSVRRAQTYLPFISIDASSFSALLSWRNIGLQLSANHTWLVDGSSSPSVLVHLSHLSPYCPHLWCQFCAGLSLATVLLWNGRHFFGVVWKSTSPSA